MAAGGVVCSRLCFGFLLQSVVVGRNVNDDLQMKRRGVHSVEFSVDDSVKARGANITSDRQRAVSFTRMAAMGQRPVPGPKEGFNSRTLPPAATWNSGVSGGSGSDEFESGGFVGKVQHSKVKRSEVVEQVRSRGRVKRAVERGGGGRPLSSPLTFQSPEAYVIAKLKIYATFKIYFQLKTTQANGLVLYSGQSGSDFLAVELVGGHVRYSYDVGSSPRSIRVNLRHPVNDNRWHDVTIFRQTLTEQVLSVDNASKVDRLTDTHSVHFDITGEELYIGGVPRSLYGSLVKQVKSRDGFQGCLASIDLNKGDSGSILEQGAEIPFEYQDQIKEGCDGAVSECNARSCDNRGICIQEWNSFTCDCDMTSFTGPTCSEDAVAYTFGSEGALVTFSYGESERMDSRQDSLAFGFRTTRREGVLLQVTSSNSNDYMELVLVDGNLFAVYNMGNIDHPIGELSEKVNDGRYHVVRFHRNGANSTLQVDDLPVLSKHPSGRQLTRFNHLSEVHIGGKRDTMGKLVQPFHGTIAGVVLNGRHLLQMAAEGDRRIRFDGEVQLEVKPLWPQHQSQTTSLQTKSPSASNGESTTKSVKHLTNGCKKTDPGCALNSTTDVSKERATRKSSDLTKLPMMMPVPANSSTDRSSAFDPYLWSSSSSSSSSGDDRPPCDTDDDDDDDDDDECGGGESYDGSDSVGHISREEEDDDDDIITAAAAGNRSTRVQMPRRPPPQFSAKDDDGATIALSQPANNARRNQAMYQQRPLAATTTITTTITVSSSTLLSPADDESDHRTGISAGKQVTPPSNTRLKITSSAAAAAASGATDSSRNSIGSSKNTAQEEEEEDSQTLSALAIIGITASVLFVALSVAFVFYKYRSRDEGSYKVDESRNYGYEACNSKPLNHLNGAKTKSSSRRHKRKDVEWYV